MQIGVFAKTFEGKDPAAVFGATVRAGFGAVQYNMACSGLASMPDEVPAEVAQAVADAAGAARIEVVAVSGTYNMIHPDKSVRERGHARLEAIARACGAMGTRLITLCTGTRDPDDQWRGHPDNAGPDAWSDLLESFAVAVRIAETHDVYLGIEPELANVVDSARRARRLIDELGSDRLRIVLDPANLFEVASPQSQRDIVAAASDLLGDRIAIGHAKDRDARGGFASAGQGVLDYPHYFARLRAVGFDGPMITHGLTADEAPAVAKFLTRIATDAGYEVRA
jgi:sugar phosphate isomerase/epimerase